MAYQLAINDIIVGTVQITGGDSPAFGGKFTPNHQFEQFKGRYEKYYSEDPKFEGSDYEEEIRLAKTPAIAARMGNTREYTLRADWEEVKEKIMYDALKAKFTQHNECRKLLLQTRDALLIEHTKNDSYWADGGDGKGKNRLGVLLMELRDELKHK